MNDLLILDILELVGNLFNIAACLLEQLIEKFHFPAHAIFMLLRNVTVLDVELLQSSSLISRGHSFLFTPQVFHSLSDSFWIRAV